MYKRQLFLLLWACTIVGFPVKLYSYRMVPYILAENPQARPAETLRLSRQMMRGNKWRCFVLDLTFYLHWTFLPLLASTVLGTAIGLATGDVALCQSLAAAAAGLLSLLFVNGYRSATDAGLYAALRQAQLDAGTPLSALFVVPAFGETAPAGEKPRLPDADVRLPEDPVFHYAQRHKLDYNRHYGLRTLILLFFTFAFIGWVWEVALHIVDVYKRQPTDAVQVSCPPRLLDSLPAGRRQSLLAVLAQDPRPGYQDEPGRVYGFPFAGFEVHFTVEGGVLTVLSITPT